MKTKDVKQIVQQIAKDEFTLFLESYTSKDGISPRGCIENISQWALNAWDCRSDEEIRRDHRLGLNPDSYIIWAFETFEKIYNPEITQDSVSITSKSRFQWSKLS